GFILGPALGGLLSHYGYSTPILFAAGLTLLNFLYASWRLGDPIRPAHHEKPERLLRFLKDPYIRRMCACNFLFTVGVTQLEAIFAFFMMDRFGYDAAKVAYLLVMMAFIMVGIQGGLIKRLVLRFGEKNLLLAGGILLAGAFAALPSIHEIWILLLPLAVSAVGRGISQPSMMSLASKGAADAHSGSVMGVFQASASLARIFGPLVAGYLYDQKQFGPFLLAAAMMLLVFLLSLGIPLGLRRNSLNGMAAEGANLSTS
ncbi:MAG: MFS transporter, partial [Bacteroidota bacterium]